MGVYPCFLRPAKKGEDSVLEDNSLLLLALLGVVAVFVRVFFRENGQAPGPSSSATVERTHVPQNHKPPRSLADASRRFGT